MTALARVVYFPAPVKTNPPCPQCGRESERRLKPRGGVAYKCPVHGALPESQEAADITR